VAQDSKFKDLRQKVIPKVHGTYRIQKFSFCKLIVIPQSTLFTQAQQNQRMLILNARRSALMAAMLAVAMGGGADAFAPSIQALARPRALLRAPAGMRQALARAFTRDGRRAGTNAVPTMQLQPGSRDGAGGEQGTNSLAKPAVWAAWLLYMQHIFLRYPAPTLTRTNDTNLI